MAPHPATPQPVPMGLRIVAVIKLVTATLLAVAALGILKSIHKDLGDMLEPILLRLHIDPENRVINAIIDKIDGLDANHLKAIGAGTLFYSLLYYVEGFGLWFGKHWAEYLVIIITASLLPLEIYEVVEKCSGLRVLILVVNLAMVTYLVWRVRADRKAARAALAKNSGRSGTELT